jgi:hypothetical protein|nr:MAG: hypothetical protein [Bacteriophage sp.]
MENREVKDIAIIANLLDGKVKFRKIEWSQILMGKHGESFNDLHFIGKKHGVYFYTSRTSLDRLCYLNNKDIPTYVVCEESKNVFKIE